MGQYSKLWGALVPALVPMLVGFLSPETIAAAAVWVTPVVAALMGTGVYLAPPNK